MLGISISVLGKENCHPVNCVISKQ